MWPSILTVRSSVIAYETALKYVSSQRGSYKILKWSNFISIHGKHVWGLKSFVTVWGLNSLAWIKKRSIYCIKLSRVASHYSRWILFCFIEIIWCSIAFIHWSVVQYYCSMFMQCYIDFQELTGEVHVLIKFVLLKCFVHRTN